MPHFISEPRMICCGALLVLKYAVPLPRCKVPPPLLLLHWSLGKHTHLSFIFSGNMPLYCVNELNRVFCKMKEM